jgi:hypothetical protein
VSGANLVAKGPQQNVIVSARPDRS